MAVELDLGDAFPTRELEFYGRSAASLGEDGESLIAAGHDRRSLAALVAAARYHDIESLEVGDIQRRWGTFHETCGCTEEQRAAGDDRQHVRSGLPPCTPGEYAWVFTRCEQGTPGAVPVTEWSA